MDSFNILLIYYFGFTAQNFTVWSSFGEKLTKKLKTERKQIF